MKLLSAPCNITKIVSNMHTNRFGSSNAHRGRLINATAARSSSSSSSSTIKINHVNAASASIPLICSYRPRWPQPPLHGSAGNKMESINVPDRTVPDSALRFKLNANFDHGSGILYPHLKFNPADFKVIMKVSLADLGLSIEEQYIFIEMIGPRYNTGKREVSLTCDRFPNRIENKRYLVLLLENLIAEAKKLYRLSPQFQ